MPNRTSKSGQGAKPSGDPVASIENPLVRLPSGVTHPVDIYVGDRLRARRTLLGLTQEALAGAVGLTFQQIQKYERGTNRIGASKLFMFSQRLGVSVGYFFEGIGSDLGDPAAGYAVGMDYQRNNPPAQDIMNRHETLELVRAYYQLKDAEKHHPLRLMF